MRKETLEKSKICKYDDLTDGEKQEWTEYEEYLLEKVGRRLLTLWVNVLLEKECIFCKCKFPKGIANLDKVRTPYPNAFYWFNAEYLVHCKQTHGFDPEVITMFLEDIKCNPQKVKSNS